MVCGFMFCVHINRIHAQTDFICGVDVSSLTQIESSGGLFYDENGTLQTDVLAYFQSQGVNTVRLRLWNNPADGLHHLDYNLALAKRIHALGMKIFLDFHYSDTWADPAHQTKPAEWENLSFDELRQAVFDYTSEVMQAFIAQDTPPAMVQIGNEITFGMLWDDGHITDSQGWSNLIALLNAGTDAIRQTSPETEIIIHLHTGGDHRLSTWFFDHILYTVDFDIIGLSYYPWWSGRFTQLSATINILAYRYGKPILIAETAYPWTFDWADDFHNAVGNPDQIERGYPATPEGQHLFLLDLIYHVQQTPENLGVGFVYWESANITTPQLGSYWENLAQFDFDGHALPSIRAYHVCQ